VASSLFAFRQKKWFFVLWLPAALWSLFGSIVFLSSFTSFISSTHEGGESAGFMAMAAMFVMVRTFLFVVALVCCGIAHPRKEQIQFRFFAPPVLGATIFLIGVSFFTRCYRSVLVIDSENKPVANALVSYSSSDEYDLIDQLFTSKGTVETDSNGNSPR
jgi:xanthine/uracil permease